MPPYCETLISAYLADYAEKVFYFCLKKTGGVYFAEDLASDITLCVVRSLRRGTIPEHFSAWVWKIARNRYARWAQKKRRQAESVSGADIGEFELEDDGQSAERELIRGEELGALRRELAFISKDYRETTVAYYIEGRKIREIAKNLGLPEGTVMSKLCRSRKKLKEGMNMAREFGVRSYKPEEISFSASGNQPSGLPWSAVRRKIPQNILLEANNNPSTVEELSVELGIAAPYVEEEIELLFNATLLEKTGGKYVTNFFIAGKECQLAIYQAQRRDGKERSETFGRIISDSIGEIEALGLYKCDMNADDKKWLYMCLAADYFPQQTQGYNITCPIKRNDGGDWGFMGYEICEKPEDTFMGDTAQVIIIPCSEPLKSAAITECGTVRESLDITRPSCSRILSETTAISQA